MEKSKIVVLMTCVALSVFGVWLYIDELGGVLDASIIQSWLESLNPFWFFASMVVLPAFGVPVSPFLVVAGAIYPIEKAIGGCSAALTLNMILTWGVSGRWLRPFCERILAKFGYSVPSLGKGDFIKVAVLVRLTPAFPFALQNYFLGVARMPFLWYLLVSVPISFLIDAGIILFGGALLEGNVGMICGAVSLIVLMSFFVRSVRSRMVRNTEVYKFG